jgi:hypothetical protein
VNGEPPAGYDNISVAVERDEVEALAPLCDVDANREQQGWASLHARSGELDVHGHDQAAGRQVSAGRHLGLNRAGRRVALAGGTFSPG